ncbi:hypothetical protein MSG28_001761 [Choristoneura fumiferana]|uniref:Uncharacterized protein n=1 Tax=Choristoneura fumiferana TaxID=7141 RepID=A0ACC0KVJ0_CHOFU|nr:hypothetical protein MSG28_001761 [Choristoneura fumiferana]
MRTDGPTSLVKGSRTGFPEQTFPFMTRPIDPDESVRINSDDESIPYKKDVSAEDSPLPTEPVKIVEDSNVPFTYGQPYPPPPLMQPYQTEGFEPQGYEAQPYDETVGLPQTSQAQQQPQSRQWAGETEIN